ncbi:MAG TPA: nitrate reductase [Gammaproteobacteria bacterium]|nr:nitrate reductase [Gammaproteobacteria bacterium]
MKEKNLSETTVCTTCPYCGVGCGVVAMPQADGMEVRGDEMHPSNFGRLCSKGSALGQTVGLEGRLLYPEINGERCDWDAALSEVANRFQQTIAEHGPDSVAFYVSGQLLTEDYYVANKLMKGYIGSANIDTNSRLCMSSVVAGQKRAFGADAMPCAYEDLERAKLIVIVGSNAAWCHPVLFQRIVQAKQDNPDLIVVVIDPRRTATCDTADIHLAVRPGSDAVLFTGLLHYLDQKGEKNHLFVDHHTEGSQQALVTAAKVVPTIESVAFRCGLKVDEVTEFYRLFSRTERVITAYSQGVNQSVSGTDKVNSIINCHLFTGRIGRPGMGPFSFTGQPNAMGGREVGGLANQLAAHMEIGNVNHRDIVQRFWQSPTIPDKPGLKAIDLFRAVESGQVKAVWVMATNPAVTLPDADRVRAALKKCDFVVISDCVEETDTTALAHVLLPAAAWGEKDGSVTNSERRISRQRRFLPDAGEARPDWWIVCEVARCMGFGQAFNYDGPAAIFREHAALSGFENSGERDFDISGLSELSDDAYDRLMPAQWPIRKKGGSTPRLFSDGRFFTPGGKAWFVSVEPRFPANLPDADFPFVLNTGRVRDQWHTMSRTGKSPLLSEHSPEPYVEMSTEDAKKARVAEGMLVHIISRWGKAVVRVRISDGQQRGSVFVPMHWSEQYSSSGCIGAVVNPECDVISGQPEFKHTPVRVVSYEPVWHGFILSRRKLDLEGVTYWVVAKGNGFYRYEIAGEQTPENWPYWARDMLCASENDVNWVEYLDQGTHRYRGVRMVNDRVESCLFIAPSHDLPSRSWLAGLFSQKSLDCNERKGLLLGKPPVGQKDVGRIVCACFSVGINTINDAIREQNLKSVEEIGLVLKAGTNCGSCVPELKALIAAAHFS